MLIDANGVACGMLSGGCLESDLVVRAQIVLETGQSQTASYQLATGDEDVWGLGIGCDGSITIGLQAIRHENDYVPFSLPTPLRLLVLGAGLDAIPLTRLAAEIGWSCTLVDHRPVSIEHADFPEACEKHCIEVQQLSAALNLDEFDGVVVMSHHLARDREYLGQLAGSSIPYMGLARTAGAKRTLAIRARQARCCHARALIRTGGPGFGWPRCRGDRTFNHCTNAAGAGPGLALRWRLAWQKDANNHVCKLVALLF